MHTCSPRDERRSGGLDAQVGEGGAQRRGVAIERVDAAQRLDRDGILVGDVRGAAALEPGPLPGGPPAGGELVEGAALELGGHGERLELAASPSSGVDACAYRRRGIRPARPAS